MSETLHSRVHVVAGATTFAVSLSLGETQISVKLPRPSGSTQISEEQLRTTALRLARRALQVGLEEIGGD